MSKPISLFSIFLVVATPLGFAFAQQPAKASRGGGAPSGVIFNNAPAAATAVPATVTAPVISQIPTAPAIQQTTGGVPCIGIGCAQTQIVPNLGITTMTPVVPVMNPVPYFPPPMPTMNIWNTLSNACFTLSAATYRPPVMFKSSRRALDRANDSSGFLREYGFNDGEARRAGRSLDARLSESARACQKFIDKEGRVGSWGRTALAAMENEREVYENHEPDDVTEYCPSFSGMSAERRKLFWVWLFASMSAPESSCNPNLRSFGTGLFQMDSNGCRVAGVHVNERELLDPHTNIRCAVARFAFEMKRRPTIMATHSRNATGTYWGVLRGDSAHPVDQNGADRTRKLISEYPDCHQDSPSGESESEPQIEPETSAVYEEEPPARVQAAPPQNPAPPRPEVQVPAPPAPAPAAPAPAPSDDELTVLELE